LTGKADKRRRSEDDIEPTLLRGADCKASDFSSDTYKNISYLSKKEIYMYATRMCKL